MISQLVQRMVAGGDGNPPMSKEAATDRLFRADPFDITLHMEQIWRLSGARGARDSAGPALRTMWDAGEFATYAPTEFPAWAHLVYSYLIENTRIAQILRRVVREYRAGEGLGLPSIETQQWLDATETMLFGAATLMPSWFSTSSIRQDPEAVRRNAYWRVLGLELAFGSDDDRPAVYDKATVFNRDFVRVLEALFSELEQAMVDPRSTAAPNAHDADVFRIADELSRSLRSRRQNGTLQREELAASTMLGWAELTVSTDSPVVRDLGASAANPADRLQLIGERVGLSAHSRSASLFSMAADLSIFLQTIEAGLVSSAEFAWLLYLEQTPPGKTGKPIGREARRVIADWSAAVR